MPAARLVMTSYYIVVNAAPTHLAPVGKGGRLSHSPSLSDSVNDDTSQSVCTTSPSVAANFFRRRRLLFATPISLHIYNYESRSGQTLPTAHTHLKLNPVGVCGT